MGENGLEERQKENLALLLSLNSNSSKSSIYAIIKENMC